MSNQLLDAPAAVPNEPNGQWESLQAQIRAGAGFDVAYVVMNVLATILACYGLLADNATAVIGAMVVAQLLGPILGIALSMVDGDGALLRKGFATLVGGVVCVMITASLLGLLHRHIPPSAQLLSRTSPQFSDLMIALAGGAAAAYATVFPRLGTALVGVAVATAMVPPLCASAIFLGRGDLGDAAQAFLLAFVNMVAIQFAASLVLWVCGPHPPAQRWRAGYRTVVRNWMTVTLLTAMGVLLLGHSYRMVSDAMFTATTSSVLREELQRYPGTYLAEVRHAKATKGVIVNAVVRGPRPLSAGEVAALQAKLPPDLDGMPVELRVRFIHITVIAPSEQREAAR